MQTLWLVNHLTTRLQPTTMLPIKQQDDSFPFTGLSESLRATPDNRDLVMEAASAIRHLDQKVYDLESHIERLCEEIEHTEENNVRIRRNENEEFLETITDLQYQNEDFRINCARVDSENRQLVAENEKQKQTIAAMQELHMEQKILFEQQLEELATLRTQLNLKNIKVEVIEPRAKKFDALSIKHDKLFKRKL